MLLCEVSGGFLRYEARAVPFSGTGVVMGSASGTGSGAGSAIEIHAEYNLIISLLNLTGRKLRPVHPSIEILGFHRMLSLSMVLSWPLMS